MNIHQQAGDPSLMYHYCLRKSRAKVAATVATAAVIIHAANAVYRFAR